jgi:Spy/CpxP family protein refolding chaperone
MMMVSGEKNVVMQENQEANKMSFWSVVGNVFDSIVENGAKKLESDIRRGEGMLKNRDLTNNQREALQNNIEERRKAAAQANDFIESKKRR